MRNETLFNSKWILLRETINRGLWLVRISGFERLRENLLPSAVILLLLANGMLFPNFTRVDAIEIPELLQDEILKPCHTIVELQRLANRERLLRSFHMPF